MPTTAPVVSAGAVVLRGAERRAGRGVEVLLVHRPKYDDWSLPKGKLDEGERPGVAAVREVAEETGLDIRLGPPLTPQSYVVGHGRDAGRHKVVHYWVGKVVGGDDVAGYARKDEVDEVRWVPVDEARACLSYPHDAVTLTEARRFPEECVPLLMVRHAKAYPRKEWRHDDRERPLTDDGRLQAEDLVPLLGAYGVQRVVSSSSRRCWTTVAPYAEAADLDVEVTDRLTEEGASAHGAARQVRRLVDSAVPAALCTHRPVLPLVFRALHVDPPRLAPGALVVVHHRRGRIVSLEHHDATQPG